MSAECSVDSPARGNHRHRSRKDRHESECSKLHGTFRDRNPRPDRRSVLQIKCHAAIRNSSSRGRSGSIGLPCKIRCVKQGIQVFHTPEKRSVPGRNVLSLHSSSGHRQDERGCGIPHRDKGFQLLRENRRKQQDIHLHHNGSALGLLEAHTRGDDGLPIR